MRPFLKWPGSKYRIVDAIKARLPEGNRLVEPFVGSGAVFLNTDYNRYLLNDNNPDHGFNGLIRYNLQHEFNVPFGEYKKPYFPLEEMRFFWKKSKKATFTCRDFTVTMSRAKKGDVFYCDPPYVPLSATSNFTSYSAGGFSLAQQAKLAELAEKLSGKGIPVLISNHDTAFTAVTYQNAEVSHLQVRRFISCDGDNRNEVGEVLALFNSGEEAI